jgi:hypothetical protein
MPMILGGLHGIRAARTSSLEVLVSPPLPDLASWVVGCYNIPSKTPSGTGSRWKPLLIDHQLLHSPHEGCGAGLGLQNPFPASGHGAGT